MKGTYGAKHKRLTSSATRTIIFQRENFNYLIVYLINFVQHVCFYCKCACRVLSVENLGNETSRQVTVDRMFIKNMCLQDKIVLQGSHVL